MIAQNRRISDQFCVFRIGTTGFAFPATAVREVVPQTTIVRSPYCASVLMGLCHLRNDFLPVLDIHGLFDLDRNSGEAATLIVLVGDEGPWAIAADRALAVETLEMAPLTRRYAESIEDTVVIATATYRDEVVRVLDAPGLYRWGQRLLDNHWHEAADSLSGDASNLELAKI